MHSAPFNSVYPLIEVKKSFLGVKGGIAGFAGVTGVTGVY